MQTALAKPRMLRRAAAVLTAAALVLAAVMAAQPAQAHAADAKPVGKICFYADSAATQPIDMAGTQNIYDVDQAVEAIKELGSATFIKSIRLELGEDWNTKGAGRIEVGEGMTLYLDLHGHMLNRAKAGSFDDKWYAEGKGEAIYVKKNGTLIVDGGTGAEALTAHNGTLEDNDNFWSYSASGKDAILGGLITGGACDDQYGAGGISLAGDGAKAYLSNVTVAGNLTDQWDSSYGHGAGVALHGKGCGLELSNAKIDYNHAEGTGGGVYVRKDYCTVTVKAGSEVKGNLGVLGGGGIYVDGNDCDLSIEGGKIAANATHKDGGGVYFNCKRGFIDITEGGQITNNSSKKDGAGIYNCYNDTTIDIKGTGSAVCDNASSDGDGGGLYLEDATDLTLSKGAKISGNKAENGAGVYVNDSGTDITLNDDSEISGNSTNPVHHRTLESDTVYHHGGGIYHNGMFGTVTLNDDAKICDNTAAEGHGGGICDNYNWTTFTLNGNSSICGNSSAEGAGLYLNDEATVTLNSNATIANNKATSSGGGISTYDDVDINLNDNTQICKNRAVVGGAFYVEGETTLQLKGNACVTGNKASAGGAAKCIHAFKVTGEDPDKNKIIDNAATSGYAASIVSSSTLILDNVTVGQSANGGKGKGMCWDIWRLGDFLADFELYGVVKITGIMFNDGQYITGGKLEAGSSVGVHFDAYEVRDGYKLCNFDVLGDLLDSQDKQDVFYPTYDKFKLVAQRGEDEKHSGIYFAMNDQPRKLIMHYGDNNEKTAVLERSAYSDTTFDGTLYTNSKNQYPVRWDDEFGCNYAPDDNGEVSLYIKDESLDLYAYYADTQTITIKYGDGQTQTKQRRTGSTMSLAGADYKKGDSLPTSWRITDASGNSRVFGSAITSKNANFTVPNSAVTLEAMYATTLQSVSLTLGESASYDDIESGVALDGMFSSLTANSLVLTNTDGEEAQPDAAALANELKVYKREVTTADDGKSKTVTYSVSMSRDLFFACNMELKEPISADSLKVQISLPQVGIVESSLDYTPKVNAVNFKVTVSYPKPSATDKSVAVKCVNVNDVSQTIATENYKVAKDGTVTIPKPEVTGWGLYGWDTTALPSCATVDTETGELKISNPASNVTLRALFKEQASQVAIGVPTLKAGEAFPSKLDSCKVTTYEEKDITSVANSDVSIAWTKEDGSAAGDTVEANGSYRATVIFKYSADNGNEFDWLDNARAYVNGLEVASFEIDPFAYKATASYLVTVGSEAQYDKVSELTFVPTALSNKSDYVNHLPDTITYLLSNGQELPAQVTWSDETVDDEMTGGFDAVGSFRDVFGGLHEVSNSFTLDALAAPKLSLRAGTYAGAQSATISADSAWGSSSDVKMYYAVGAAGATSSEGLEFKECNDGTAIDIPESCTLFVYAAYGDKSSLIESYSYTIKAGHVVSVASGSASDGKGNAVTSAAEGQTVRLAAADAAEGMAFDKWKVTGGTQVELKDASSASTSFTMPDGEVSIEAVYKESPDDSVVASGADVKLPAIAAGDSLPIAAKAALLGPNSEEIDTVAVQLQWKDASDKALSAGSAAQAGATYTATAAVLLEEGAAAWLGKDTAISFNGRAAKSQDGPDENAMMTASYEVKIAGAQATSVSCKGCTYTLAGGKLTLSKVNKRSAKTVTVPAKVKINGKKLKVAKIKAKAFKGTKAVKLIVKSPYLTKKGVKGSLAGAKVKVVQVKAHAGKKANAKLLAKYKRFFKKANSGKKVTVR